MTDQLRLKVNTEKPESENRWYIVRKVITKRWGFLPNKVEWIPLTCSEVGYPRYGRHLPTDVSYFYDDYCASVACMKL
jgi:hypothetical protein